MVEPVASPRETDPSLSDYPNNCELLVETDKDHVAVLPHYLSFPQGIHLRVVNRQRQDVWKVQMKNVTGWVPSSAVRVIDVSEIGSEKWLDSMRQCRINGNEHVCEYAVMGSEVSRDVCALDFFLRIFFLV